MQFEKKIFCYNLTGCGKTKTCGRLFKKLPTHIPMPVYATYLLPPIAGAIIGWLTNYVAIKMLFRPHVPIKIMGFTIQGLIPRRRKEISKGIAKVIEAQLLSAKDITSTLDGVDWKTEVEDAVSEIIEHRFRSTGIKKIPIIGLLSENIVYHIKYLVTKDILAQVEKKKDVLTKRFTDTVDIKEMLASRIDSLDFKRFEGLLTEFIARELRHIEWLGGAMGFMIGLVQAGIMLFFG